MLGQKQISFLGFVCLLLQINDSLEGSCRIPEYVRGLWEYHGSFRRTLVLEVDSVPFINVLLQSHRQIVEATM